MTTEVPILSDLLIGGDVPYASVDDFVFLVVWNVAMVAVVTVAWSWWSKGDFSFLHPNRWIYIGYAVLLGVGVILALQPTLLNMPGWLQVICMIVGTACQALVAFGYLQTALERWVSRGLAAGITALMFAGGHFIWIGSFDILIAIGAIVFALARMYTGRVYLTHMIHLGFYWVSLWMV